MTSKTSKSIGGTANVPRPHAVPKGGADSGKPGVKGGGSSRRGGLNNY